MHIKKTITLKRYKKQWEKYELYELQKRKSNLFNKKLELIKMNKYTHTKYIHTAALCIDSKMGKAVVQDHSTWLVKRKKNETHAHTGMHAHMQK